MPKILGIALRTVIFHLERITEKLGASCKSLAISWALKQGVVSCILVLKKWEMSVAAVNDAEPRNILLAFQ
jgi:hypothetical protein